MEGGKGEREGGRERGREKEREGGREAGRRKVVKTVCNTCVVISSLHTGMVEVLQLMQGGYPSRTQFVDFYNM